MQSSLLFFTLWRIFVFRFLEEMIHVVLRYPILVQLINQAWRKASEAFRLAKYVAPDARVAERHRPDGCFEVGQVQEIGEFVQCRGVVLRVGEFYEFFGVDAAIALETCPTLAPGKTGASLHASRLHGRMTHMQAVVTAEC